MVQTHVFVGPEANTATFGIWASKVNTLRGAMDWKREERMRRREISWKSDAVSRVCMASVPIQHFETHNSYSCKNPEPQDLINVKP